MCYPRDRTLIRISISGAWCFIRVKLLHISSRPPARPLKNYTKWLPSLPTLRPTSTSEISETSTLTSSWQPCPRMDPSLYVHFFVVDLKDRFCFFYSLIPTICFSDFSFFSFFLCISESLQEKIFELCFCHV